MDRRADAPAGRAPAQVLRPPACRPRRTARRVPRVHDDGGRAREAARRQMTTHPPPLAVALLNRRLSGEWRDFVVGDLTEEFDARARTSASAARRWFWWQTLRCLVAPPNPSSLVHPSPSSGDSLVLTLLA